jgi:hypothetical protein
MRSRRFGCLDVLGMILVVSLCTAGHAQTTGPVPQIANPLVPTAVVPGSPAFTLTVNGTGFVSGSTVYWNGSPRTTTFVSTAQLMATITAADVETATSGVVTVHGPTGRISNPIPLLVTNVASSISFGATQINSIGGDVLSADVNGDGNPDSIVNLGTSILVALGNGDGSLQPPTLYSLGSGIRGYDGAVGDFNNDGLPDVVAWSFNPSAIQIMLDSAGGALALGSPLSLSSDTSANDSIATADFNGDGNLDLVFPGGDSGGGFVGVSLGNGDGTFQPPVYYPLPYNSYWVAVGDFNRDGIPDIAASIDNYGGISILLGNGDGTFQPQVNYGNGIATFFLSVADLNGDGYPDIIGSDINENSFFVFMNAGNGTLLPAVNYHGPQGGVSFSGTAVGDMNGDGKPDVVIQAASFCPNNCIEIFLGNGDGTLQPGTTYGTQQNFGGGGGGEISLADFNHDGKLDIGTPITDEFPFLMVQSAGPEPTLVPGTLTFASQAVGSQSQPQTVTLYQPGSTAITVNSIVVSGDFQYNGGCVGVLNAGNTSCSFSVSFLPTTDGLRTGSVTINSSGGIQNMSLVGTATPAINVSVTPTSLSFGTELLNSTSFTQKLYITNTGSQILDLTNIALTGANPGDFLMTNPCGSTLAVGASCTVSTNFHPTAQGVRTASVSVYDNAANSPQTVALSGTGTALSLSTTLLNFGNVTVGASSAQTLLLHNVGAKPIAIGQITIVGNNAKNYSQANNCGTSIAARGNCMIRVTFTPEVQGQLNSVLTFSSTGTGTHAVTSITLKGRGE